MFSSEISEDYLNQLEEKLETIRSSEDDFISNVKTSINDVIKIVQDYDPIQLLGGFGAKHIISLPSTYSEVIREHKLEVDKSDDLLSHVNPDENIEVLLEYLLSISTAFKLKNSRKDPDQELIDELYDRILSIKNNLNMFSIAKQIPDNDSLTDNWLRTIVMTQSMNVRGNAFDIHEIEVFDEVFGKHDDFFNHHFGFSSVDIKNAVIELDMLVLSTLRNGMGPKLAHERFVKWTELIGIDEKSEKNFIQQFTSHNPDLYSDKSPLHITLLEIDDIKSYGNIFWVVPFDETQKEVFESISLEFGDNQGFLKPDKFKAFPLNDTLIRRKPLIKQNDRFYNFSMTLAFRNLFVIAENLILEADKDYYENNFRGNSNEETLDNYLETKTLNLFQNILPDTEFYHSLYYEIEEDGITKNPELDILGVSDSEIFIIEVKSGRLSKKHKRGAIKGLKDRIEETIGEGSYQCYRAQKYIKESEAVFSYVDDSGERIELALKDHSEKEIFKISVTFEHFSDLSTNLGYLIDSEILGEEYKWAWIVSLYDLIVFSDLFDNQSDFVDFLKKRLSLYDRRDVMFTDELDILGFYLKSGFPIKKQSGKVYHMDDSWKEDIVSYYTSLSIGTKQVEKPQKVNS